MGARKRSANKRAPKGGWPEIRHLYHKILDWFYAREDRRRAARYCDRLERLLEQWDANQEVIFGQECRSLVSEVRGDFVRAIAHRKNEIQLWKGLLKTLHRPPTEAERGFILKYFGYEDLSDRLDLLAILYRDAGQLKKAIKTLWQSRELCELHGVKFDGKDLLRDYLAEYRSARAAR